MELKRILFGEAPVEFLLEILIRTLIIYVFTLMIVRWFGQRMSGEISITEMAIMILIGAIIAVPMQHPESGILQGIIALLTILLVYHGVNWLTFKKRKAEKVIQGSNILLVKDGVMQLDQMKGVRVSKQQLYAALRNKKVFNLGQVKRVYLEACGLISLYKQEEPKPGLPLFPPGEEEALLKQEKKDSLACANCGAPKHNQALEAPCPNCHSNAWVNAYLSQ